MSRSFNDLYRHQDCLHTMRRQDQGFAATKSETKIDLASKATEELMILLLMGIRSISGDIKLLQREALGDDDISVKC